MKKYLFFSQKIQILLIFLILFEIYIGSAEKLVCGEAII